MAKKKDVKKLVKEHSHFLGLLVLLVGFSSYAMLSFMFSNNDYLNYLSANVASSTPILVNEEVDLSNIPQDNPFTDLNLEAPYYEAVVDLYYKGIVSGYIDGTFKPDNKVNRAEFAKMLVEAASLDYTDFEAEKLSHCFIDVTDFPEHWFAPSACASKVAGWISGYTDGSFKPSKNITQAEALKIILVAFDFKIAAAAPGSPWYSPVEQAAIENALLGTFDIFDPAKEVSRAEVATLIYRAL